MRHRPDSGNDELASEIYSQLPGVNCRACGYPSCMDCARAIADITEKHPLRGGQAKRIAAHFGEDAAEVLDSLVASGLVTLMDYDGETYVLRRNDRDIEVRP